MLNHLSKELRLRATLADLQTARQLIRDCNAAYPSIRTGIRELNTNIQHATELLVALDKRK